MKKNKNSNRLPLIAVAGVLLVIAAYAAFSNIATAASADGDMEEMMGSMKEMHGECTKMMGSSGSSPMSKPEGMSQEEHESHHR